jgi:eukaryotic-like serine/threonine-protein kinase
MADNQLSLIESIFHAALDLPVADRDAYIRHACNGDEVLLAEVSSLLATAENGNGFIDEPALTAGLDILRSTAQESPLGKSIGCYRIIRPLGKGGMGEVFLAEDTRLNRKVALKFLSPELGGDNWAKRQLFKEAQAAARLDHPNICSVHGFEDSGEYNFIVMQFIEGETLADLISQERIKPHQVIELTRQIVSALAEAHAHGIIHRDVKPKNIMVTESRQVKVLDFGLAKTVHTKKGLAPQEDSVSHLSQSGLLAGTVSYMSPEQLRGDRLDYRTDVFSLGTVVYEMATGKNPYAQGSTAETISSILTAQPPPLADSAPEVLRPLGPIVTKCAQKNLDQRYQAASALLHDLNNLQTAVKPRSFPRTLTRPRAIAVLALLLFSLTLGAIIYARMFTTYSLAVLPIVNETGPANDFFGHGLTAAITEKLSGVTHLRVKPRTTVSNYKAYEVDLQKLGTNLGVDAFVLGRIIEEQGSLVLEVTLVDGTTGDRRHIGKHNLTLSSAYAIPEEVSRQVTSNLDMWLRSKDNKHLAEVGTSNPEAFRQYMLGSYYYRNRDKENIEKSVRHFYEAINLDPLYADAYAGLADCYALRNTVGFGDLTTEEAMHRAKWAANEALRLNKNLPRAHTALAVIYLKYDWNWVETEKEIKRALELDPDYAPAHYAYSMLLTVLNRQNEAIEQSKITRDLDPFSMSSKTNYCRSFYYARDFDSSVSCFREILNEDRNNTLAKYVSGFVDLQKGNVDEAIDVFQELYAKEPKLGAAALGYAYGKTGRKDEALKILSFAQEQRNKNGLPAQELAIIYLGLGDKSNAVSWLEKAYDDHFSLLIYLTVEPIFQELHSEPRFMAIAQRMNLAPVGSN